MKLNVPIAVIGMNKIGKGNVLWHCPRPEKGWYVQVNLPRLYLALEKWYVQNHRFSHSRTKSEIPIFFDKNAFWSTVNVRKFWVPVLQKLKGSFSRQMFDLRTFLGRSGLTQLISGFNPTPQSLSLISDNLSTTICLVSIRVYVHTLCNRIDISS